MQKKKSHLIWICLVLVLVSACTQGKLLYQDDFSDTNSGWDVYNGDTGTNGYIDGQYVITVKESKFDRWALANQDFKNVSISVQAVKKSGPDDNNYGIICNYSSLNQYYMFLISSDGYYMIQKATEDGLFYLSGAYFEESDLIKKGNATNSIRAVCSEETLSLYINNRLVESVVDKDYTHGDVGLVAGTYNIGNVSIAFDNFHVRKTK